MRLAAGLRWGSLSAPPDPLAAIRGGVPTSKGEGREWEKGRKGMGRGGREGRLASHTILGPEPPQTKILATAL